MNACHEIEVNRAGRYRELCIRHLNLFRGKWYDDTTTGGKAHFAEASQAGLAILSNRVSKLVVNHLFGIVGMRISRLMRIKPEVDVDPANSEYSDRISAKLVKLWLNYLFYQQNISAKLVDIARATFIYGEAYGGVFWNPNLGEPNSDWRDEVSLAKKENRPPRLPVKDEEGNPVRGASGDDLYIEKPIKTGDVEIKVLTPLNTLIQAAGMYDAADYMIYEEFEDIDKLKALYPEKAEEIKQSDADALLPSWRTIAGVEHMPVPGRILVRYFYHRPTEFLASGRFTMSTHSALLENMPLPEGQEGLPIVRLTDIDVPNVSRGQSFFTQGKSIAACINDFSSMMRRNAMMVSHPRWVVPRGSVIKREALGNEITQIEYAGPVAPQVVAPPPMSQEINQLRNNLKDDLFSILNISDMETGKVPANVRSALGQQAAEEQADQRANNITAKFTAFIEGLAEKAVNLASAYYEKGDKRLIPMVGRDNQYIIKEFDPSHLRKAYDIRVKNGGNMGSKSARTETLIELKKAAPDLMPDNQFLELLELGDSEKYYDSVTVAVKSAEAENEAIMNQEEISEPATFEDHVTHWTIHMRETQNRGFKTATPPQVQAALIGHIKATEYLMLITARKNPAYSINLVKLLQFPAFFDLSLPDRMLLDRARSGNPLTLVEIDQLYNQGQPPQPGMGGAAPPPPGGVPAPNPNNPLYNQLTPGAPANPQPSAPPAPPGAP